MPALPEQQARQNIDALLAAAGWAVQDYKAFDPSASLGVAWREVPLKSGRCDHLLLTSQKLLGEVVCRTQKPKPRRGDIIFINAVTRERAQMRGSMHHGAFLRSSRAPAAARLLSSRSHTHE